MLAVTDKPNELGSTILHNHVYLRRDPNVLYVTEIKELYYYYYYYKFIVQIIPVDEVSSEINKVFGKDLTTTTF